MKAVFFDFQIREVYYIVFTDNDIIGKPLTVIIPENLHDAHHLGFSRFLSTNQPTLLNKAILLNAVKKNGEEVRTEHTILAEQQAGEWVFAARIAPIREAPNDS